MTKADLVAAVTRTSGYPRARVAATLDSFLSLITEALLNHQRVEIRRFGTFEVTYRRSRVARDLNTNDALRLPARPMPRFVPFDALKDMIEASSHPASVPDQAVVIVPPELPRFLSSEARGLMPDERDVKPSPPQPEDGLIVRVDAVNANPDDPDARLALAVAYIAHQLYDSALEQCHLILHQNPVHLGAIMQLGRIREQQGDYENAIEEYERILRIDRDNLDALQHLGRLHSELGFYVEAENEFKRALELNPSSVIAHYNMGVIHTKRGLYGRAIQEFERVLELDSECFDAYFHLGRAYDHQARHDDAIRMFEALLKVRPDESRACWHLGVLYDKKKAGVKALEMYQRANLLARKGNERQ
ncbi:MAG: tetratricopeptide repeat protein [Candidatus Latescibacteria bacterium]|nr:tetratricopeptide repeat protein [Candidatus Latescibacterota bacterium]